MLAYKLLCEIIFHRHSYELIAFQRYAIQKGHKSLAVADYCDCARIISKPVGFGKCNKFCILKSQCINNWDCKITNMKHMVNVKSRTRTNVRKSYLE